MQAFRHCSLCVSGGFLQSRTDFLLLRSNMAALRRGVAYLSLLRNTASVLCNRKSTKQLLRVPETARTRIVSLSVGSALCSVPLTQPVENLSHESLIRRASCLVTDSANTFLSQTTLALVDALTQYAKALHTLIALQKRYLGSIGKLTPAEEDSIWQVIIGQRAEVGDRLDECNRFELNWMNAITVCERSAEAAYSAGAEHAFTSIKTNLQVAQAHVEEAKQLVKDAERKLAETKAEEIQRMAEYASTVDITADDIPEAYLRED
ncbi:diablo, IAP-binding mitochondrial protein a [Chanos chanos]|uniref:Direct IAP-binding protein with low pI n=1 Tax=Chanos chanos TaxID=29144 RepID=A0A6J2VPK8_CHACN|nr:diablo homolog, mitochondrial [Chanos chanos]